MKGNENKELIAHLREQCEIVLNYFTEHKQLYFLLWEDGGRDDDLITWSYYDEYYTELKAAYDCPSITWRELDAILTRHKFHCDTPTLWKIGDLIRERGYVGKIWNVE